MCWTVGTPAVRILESWKTATYLCPIREFAQLKEKTSKPELLLGTNGKRIDWIRTSGFSLLLIEAVIALYAPAKACWPSNESEPLREYPIETITSQDVGTASFGRAALALGQAGLVRNCGFDPHGLTSRMPLRTRRQQVSRVRFLGTSCSRQCGPSCRLPEEEPSTEDVSQSRREYSLLSKVCARAIVSCDVVGIA